MKVVVDECIPRRLAKDLPYDVSTVHQLKLTGLENGALLKAIEDEFDIFLTVDQNLQYQQNLTNTKIAIIVLNVISNRYEDIVPIIPSCISAINRIKQGELVTISI